MSAKTVSALTAARTRRSQRSGKLLLSTGLAFASLILVPAVAAQMGLGSSLTGALRIALMRASSRAVGRTSDGEEGATASFCCH